MQNHTSLRAPNNVFLNYMRVYLSSSAMLEDDTSFFLAFPFFPSPIPFSPLLIPIKCVLTPRQRRAISRAVGRISAPAPPRWLRGLIGLVSLNVEFETVPRLFIHRHASVFISVPLLTWFHTSFVMALAMGWTATFILSGKDIGMLPVFCLLHDTSGYLCACFALCQSTQEYFGSLEYDHTGISFV